MLHFNRFLYFISLYSKSNVIYEIIGEPMIWSETSRSKATAGKFPVSHPPPSYNFTTTPTQKHNTNCIEHFRIDFFFKTWKKHKGSLV